MVPQHQSGPAQRKEQIPGNAPTTEGSQAKKNRNYPISIKKGLKVKTPLDVDSIV